MNQQNLADFIWNVADTLRGPFRPSLYGRIILPFTVLRRLECVLEPTRAAVKAEHQKHKGKKVDLDLVLPNVARAKFYNVSDFTLATVGATSTRSNLEHYVNSFSANARQIFEHFAFEGWLVKLEAANLLYEVCKKFAAIDLHPNVLSNHEMGLVFEHLIRKFAEAANDDAGEYFTPRDVVRLTTTLVFDREELSGDGRIFTVYDCAAGTGGFLSSAIEQVKEWNPDATVVPYGQELNPETYAICVADKLIQNFDVNNLKLGNTLSNDLLPHERFDYCLANPPFGVKWEPVQKAVIDHFGERDPAAQPVTDVDGSPMPDAELREYENVPLKDSINAYFEREVLPHVRDAWIDRAKTDEKDGKTGVVGYEINFNRYFYVYQPPRPLEVIDAELRAVEAEIAALLSEVTR